MLLIPLQCAASVRVVFRTLVGLLLDCIAADELVESAHLPVSRLVLVEHREALLVEFLEELIPRNRLEPIVVVAREVDAQHARFIALLRALHGARPTAACLCPLPDRLIDCRVLGSFCQVTPPLVSLDLYLCTGALPAVPRSPRSNRSGACTPRRRFHSAESTSLLGR